MSEREETDDIKSALLASVAEIEEKTPGSTGKLAEVQPKVAPVVTPEPKEVTEQDAKKDATGAAVRDPATGKFLPKDKSAEVVKTTEAKPSAESAKTGAEGVKPDAAPGSLPADIKAEWANYSPATKAFLVKQEQERGQAAGKAGFELRQLKAQYEPIDALLGPRRAAVVAQHGSVETWLKQVLDYSDFAGADPEGFLSWYLSQPNIGSRVNVEKLLGQAPAGAQGDPALASPAVKALQQELSGLKSQLQQFKGGFEQRETTSFASELDAFENEKDGAGNPLHPHFATLRDNGVLAPEMHLIRQADPNLSFRQIVAKAYENAVWKYSDTRNTLLADQRQKALEDKEAKERADAASRSRKFVTGQPPGPTTPPGAPKDDVRSEIAAQMYQALEAGKRL